MTDSYIQVPNDGAGKKLRTRLSIEGEHVQYVAADEAGQAKLDSILTALDAILTAQTAILAELAQKIEAGGQVALDAASLAALESVTAVVTGSVAVTSLPAADDEGTWGYLAGTAGTVIVGASVRVIGISATADAAGATITINGGQTCSIPINTGIAIMPKGQLVAPTIVLTGTNSYFVETVSG